MRFAIFNFLAIAALSAPPIGAQTAPIDLSAAVKNVNQVRLQTGKNIPALKPGDGLALQLLTNGLGNISALAKNDTGTLYVADRQSGRLWRLPDRNQDGRFDSKQAMPQRFDEPSGLAVYDARVYVADRNAVWVINGFQPPEKLAGLLQAGSKGTYHPLVISDDGERLYLGLTKTNGEINLLTIDTRDGTAALLETAQIQQDIVALAAFDNHPPWIATTQSVGPSLSQLVSFHPSQKITALALPTSEDWPAEIKDHLLLSRQSGDGFDVIAVPTAFGQVATDAVNVLSGFLSASGRTAWGQPGALLFDAQGLIMADTKNGDLYRVSAAAKETAVEIAVTETPSAPAKSQAKSDPAQMQVTTITEGSQIGSASGLKSGSALTVGSTIIRDYKPLTLEDENLEDEEAGRAKGTEDGASKR